MLQNIQILRGIAALMVVIFHMISQIERRGGRSLIFDFDVGQAGVDIFFVISGFMMLYVTHNRNRQPLIFWRDRLIRIVPLYWFYTFVMVFVLVTLPNLLKTAQFDQLHIFKSLFFIPANHPKIHDRVWPLLIQGWTLNYEMFFYLIFGALLLISAERLRLGLLGGILGALVVLGFLVSPDGAIGQTYTSPLLLEFLVGALVGRLYVSGYMCGRLAGTICLIAGVALFAAAEWSPGWAGTRALTWGIPALLVFIGALALETSKPRPRLLRLLGDASYSIYLSHTFTLAAAGMLWSKLRNDSLVIDVSMIIVALVASAGVGVVSYRVLEQSFMSWFKRKDGHPGSGLPDGVIRRVFRREPG